MSALQSEDIDHVVRDTMHSLNEAHRPLTTCPFGLLDVRASEWHACPTTEEKISSLRQQLAQLNEEERHKVVEDFKVGWLVRWRVPMHWIPPIRMRRAPGRAASTVSPLTISCASSPCAGPGTYPHDHPRKQACRHRHARADEQRARARRRNPLQRREPACRTRRTSRVGHGRSQRGPESLPGMAGLGSGVEGNACAERGPESFPGFQLSVTAHV